MNNRQKIVVSIVGIFIVILALIGITYAYFLTRISGNTNTKSIEVTTADLALVYGDGNGILTNQNEKLLPGDEVMTKTFTVSNTGEDPVDSYVVFLESVVNPLTRPQDLVYTVTCTSVTTGTSTVNGTCEGVDTETAFPTTAKDLVLTNNIAPGITHNYTFNLKYLNPNENQTEDMNKTFSARLNIEDIKNINTYDNNTSLLSYNIINNSKLRANETSLVNKTATIPAVEASTSTEKELAVTNDDYGVSYYYRGYVTDNYVNYSGKCWRIVRIEGDGSIKLILASNTGTCSQANLTDTSAFIGTGEFGNTTVDGNVRADYLNSTTGMKYILERWKTESALNDTKLKSDSWCLGDITTKYDTVTGALLDASTTESSWYYEVAKRIEKDSPHNTTLKCTNGTKYSSMISTITADEITFAGNSIAASGLAYYLQDNSKGDWLSLSLSSNISPFGGYKIFGTYFIAADMFNGNTDSNEFLQFNSNDSKNIRSTITLIPSVQITTGNGTLASPYEISMS